MTNILQISWNIHSLFDNNINQPLTQELTQIPQNAQNAQLIEQTLALPFIQTHIIQQINAQINTPQTQLAQIQPFAQPTTQILDFQYIQPDTALNYINYCNLLTVLDTDIIDENMLEYAKQQYKQIAFYYNTLHNFTQLQQQLQQQLQLQQL